MKVISLAVIVVMSLCSPSFAGTGKPIIIYTVVDTHPTGGLGATNEKLTFQQGDPRFKVFPGGSGPGQCDSMFLGGFAFGHPDPRIKDPNAVCGHGYVFRLHFAQEAPSPLSILPIQAPMPMEEGAGAADAGKIIRDLLPRLDKSDGDKLPAVVQLRESIRYLDVLNGIRAIPKRQPR